MATKSRPVFKRVAQLKTAEDLTSYLGEIGADIPFDAELATTNSPYGQPYSLNSGRTVGNRFCILPMEGWDGTTDGRPSEHTKRRWHHFAISGAKLLWGCEAVAVHPEGRANPNQLMINEDTFPEFVSLYESLVKDHQEQFSSADDLVIGLQLTHSGRFCKPFDKKKLQPKILYAHPVLNKKFGLGDDYPVMSDEDIDSLIEDFIRAAVLAQKAGFHFVDIKHCHGYLGHEFLSAIDRGGKYGGSFENRTRFLTSIVEGIRKEAPGLEIGVRLSAIDLLPFTQAEDKVGEPYEVTGHYNYAFGGEKTGLSYDLTETKKFLHLLEELDIELLCITAGSPYYNPHVTRPALFPPSDGYLPPEDPLVGVARHLEVVAALKKDFPNLAIVGSGYSYLQEWLPNVGQAVLKNGDVDFVGIGRMVISYPEMPADILSGEGMKRAKICRTFSDCTTGPRNGMISGCFPLDPYYKQMEEAKLIKEIKKEL
ncbi:MULTISPECIES: NADH:flavin oxidoreductase [unclassified Imperialibacter]|uniref:oxidoreductase n=1 Tax=unclassified Imperialibacter TaxID=2629706 RepID=UPI00125243C3|nr:MULTISPECIES: NADH:flavin oxidoreductase [unclassified Imperialibacter]CAD5281408.1 NADH:flavin oxidoreductase [Imperialibacter sp. 89]CAD5288184.1 NADH:flavin oxidoreductase [Imperialibacter sp. 75]VVT31254.1 NADH:flavin oxidoreductase [Imperialibacter sp. EC-SDR9]